jgi:hypothetical protein
MRSYYDHLKSSMPQEIENLREEVFRSSAIFPVILNENISTRVLFLGYWMLKRHILELGCVATLRNTSGEILKRSYFLIQEPKAYRVEARDYYDGDMEGSLEIEFYSSKNLVFPFPAVVVNYYGENFSTCVHTAQRVYNDYGDKLRNTERAVNEAGFNIYKTDKLAPVISFINGPEKQPEQVIQLEIHNQKNEKITQDIALRELKPYETVFLYPNIDKAFLNGLAGSCRIKFHLEWVFPRLLVGNIHKDPDAFSITHTYYDLSGADSDKDYWPLEAEGWDPASLMIPVDLREEHFTNVYFYPIYSRSIFTLKGEFYTAKGEKIGERNDLLKISEGSYQKIDFRSLGLPSNEPIACRLSAERRSGPIPARIKIGLDMGYKNPLTPCNLCTNLQPFRLDAHQKKSSFKWAPLLSDRPGASFWLMNSSPMKNYSFDAHIQLTFYREEDTKTLARKIVLPPHGFALIEIDNDEELKHFFQNKIGWVSVITDNTFLTTYYFSLSPSGIVGGDHGF